MRYYFAPLEGITDSIYRRLHHQFFPGIDRYYTPFFSPTIHRVLTNREQRELPPADALGFDAVPQLLTKDPDDFLWMASQCADRGYREVNLNVGCPSGTVTAKGKGAGMLKDLDGLDAFLDTVCSRSPLPVSIKTRTGFESGDVFSRILDVYNRYPIAELIIHPRSRAQFYNGNVDMEAFDYALRNSKAPLCYNGNLCRLAQIRTFSEEHPQVDAVMLGRGLVADPGMLSPKGTDIKALEKFHDALLEEYLIAFGGSRNAMFRMKENWHYMLCRLNAPEKLIKRLRKVTDLGEYRAITAEVFHTLTLPAVWENNW